jgi:hypothetical protein
MAMAFAPLGMQPDQSAQGAAARGPTLDTARTEARAGVAYPLVGDDCGSPFIVSLTTADLPYVDPNTNCGRGNVYDDPSSDHCLSNYDSGEDMIYELEVMETMAVKLTLDPLGTTWSGFALGNACPPTNDCIASDYHGGSHPLFIDCVTLDPGIYYIQVDTWSTPDCIPDFTLTIEDCHEPTMAWQPVSATGAYTITDNEIVLDGGGQEVTIELQLSGWTPSLLEQYEAQVDSSGYDNGIGVPLTPLGWPTNNEDGAFIDQAHPDYVFSGVTSMPAWVLTTMDYRWGSIIVFDPPVPDGGGIYYGATLILVVPPGANGTYTIDFGPNPDYTRMKDGANQPIEPLNLVPGTITVIPSGANPIMEWQPVSATGSYTIVDNDITLLGGGQEVTLEIQMSGWGHALGAPQLRTYVGTVDSTGYSSGAGDPLSATGAFIDLLRGDFVFNGLMYIDAVDTSTADYVWGATVMSGAKPDDGGTYYGGTLTLNVPPGAEGTYTITYVPGFPETYMNDQNGAQIPGPDLVPATITVERVPPYDYLASPASMSWVIFDDQGDVPEIPADFFEPGSDPFSGQVTLRGEPIDPYTLGETSTILRRWLDPVSPGDPPGTIGAVEVELLGLRLVSVGPIIVTSDGGQNPQEWDVKVVLSSMPAIPGGVSAEKTSDNGGTYDITLEVYPLLTFTRVSDGYTRTLDSPAWGEGPYELYGSGHFVHSVSEGLNVFYDADAQWVPGIEEVVPGDPNSQVTEELVMEPLNGLRWLVHSVVPPAPPPPPPPDPHATLGGGLTYIDFGLYYETQPIPADFFGPGSDPFTGQVAMEGDPLDPATSNSSTEIQRVDHVTFPDPPPSYAPYMLAQVTALSLVSREPITVTYNGGMDSEPWDLRVGLSDLPQDLSGLQAFLVHPNGGVFDAGLGVTPKLTFTKVGNPGEVRVVDYGLAGYGPIGLGLYYAPFVVNLADHLVGTIIAPSDGNFVPGVEETIPGDPSSQVVVTGGFASMYGTVGHWVEPPKPPPPPPDPHRTLGSDYTYMDFGRGGESESVPADFFGPGSDPFDEIVDLVGDPFDPDSSDSSTEIQRADHVTFPGPPPSTTTTPIEVEILALSLASAEPITVTYYGGMQQEQWDLHVGLSDIPQEQGGLTADLTHDNGGMYHATIPVTPKLTFTKVGDPGEVRVLDYGLTGHGPFVLSLDDAPFVINLSDGLIGDILAPSNGNFVPGVIEAVPGDPTWQFVMPKDAVSPDQSVAHWVEPAQPPWRLNPPGIPTEPTHQVRKHRYLSIDPNTNPTQSTTIKVEVAEMRRCQNAPTRACLVDSDCDDVCDDVAGSPPYHTLKCPPADCSQTVPPSSCIWSGPCVDLAPTFSPPLTWLVEQPVQHPDGEWTAGLTYSSVYGEDWSAYTVLHIGDCATVPCVTYHVYACEPVNLDACSEPLEIATQRFPEHARPVAFPLYGDVCGGTAMPGPMVLPPDGYVSVKDLLVTQLTLINYGSATLPQAHATWVDLHGPGVGIPPQYILNVSDLTAVYVFGLTNTLPWVNTQGGLDPQDCP